MLPIESWRIFYADGSVFSSEDGTWAESPPFGVHAVVFYHAPAGVTWTADQDIYWHVDREAGGKEFKMGLWTDGEQYWRVHDLVMGEVAP